MRFRSTPASARARGRPVVAAGLALNGATVLRRMVELGYTPCGLSYDRSEQGWHVAGVRHQLTPDPRADFEGWFDTLLDLAEAFDEAPATLPMSDVHVVAFDRAAPRLGGAYRLHGFGSGLRTALTSKRRTFELAELHDFPRPASRWVEDRDELAAFAERSASGSSRRSATRGSAASSSSGTRETESPGSSR